MSPAETTISLVLAVGAIALMMKWFSRDDRPASSTDIDPVDALLADVSGADPATAGEIVAVTSDGWALVPDSRGIALVPHATAGAHDFDDAPRGTVEKEIAAATPGQHTLRFDTGDAVGARVRRGAPDFDPWRLEVLGRHGEFRAWFFETEEAARAALDLFERRIVRAPRDEFGDPAPPAPEDFDAARRMDEETEHSFDDPDEPDA
jgi:hypothetical protein